MTEDMNGAVPLEAECAPGQENGQFQRDAVKFDVVLSGGERLVFSPNMREAPLCNGPLLHFVEREAVII